MVVYFRNWPHTPSENVWPSSATLKEGHDSVCGCSPSYLRYAEITREEEREQPSSQVRNSSPSRSNAVGSSLQHAAGTILLSSQVNEGDKGRRWKNYFSPESLNGSFMIAYLCHTVRIYILFPWDVIISTSEPSYVSVRYSKSSNNNEAAVAKVWKNDRIRSLNTIAANKINFFLLLATFMIVAPKKLYLGAMPLYIVCHVLEWWSALPSATTCQV